MGTLTLLACPLVSYCQVRVHAQPGGPTGQKQAVRLMATSMGGQWLKTDGYVEYLDSVTGVTTSYCAIEDGDEVGLYLPIVYIKYMCVLYLYINKWVDPHINIYIYIYIYIDIYIYLSLSLSLYIYIYIYILTSTSAPARSSRATAQSWLCAAALCSGVAPNKSPPLASAPWKNEKREVGPSNDKKDQTCHRTAISESGSNHRIVAMFIPSSRVALSVITVSRGCIERYCSNKQTSPYHSNLSFGFGLTPAAALCSGVAPNKSPPLASAL